MKALQSHYFRALAAIAAGILIVEFRQDMMRWITIAVGVLFLLSGVISLVAYFGARNRKADETATGGSAATGDTTANASGASAPGTRKRPPFPLVGLGSLILGLILALMNTTFLNYVMFILAAILILGGISQLYNIVAARKYAHIGFGWWLFPCAILLCGLFVIVKALTTTLTAALSASLLLVLGWSLMLFGVVECINALKISLVRRKALKAMEAQQGPTAATGQPSDGNAPEPQPGTGEQPGTEQDPSHPTESAEA